jgi:hypothetical protein
MPHEIHDMVMTIVFSAVDTNVTSDKCELVFNWCLMAAQPDSKGDSLVAFTVDMVTEGDNENLGHHDVHQVSNIMATEVSKGVALGLRALGPLGPDPSAQGGGVNAVTRGYMKDDIAAIMGFLGVENGRNLQEIWEIFNTSHRENIVAYWQHIVARMKQWSYNCHISINTCACLGQETIKAIVELCFNPCKGVTHLDSASKGLLVLVCCTCTSTETE